MKHKAKLKLSDYEILKLVYAYEIISVDLDEVDKQVHEDAIIEFVNDIFVLNNKVIE